MSKRIWCILQYLAIIVGLTNAACPNLCSGHGSCTPDNVCECDGDFSGLDCSDLPCARGYAWADKAVENEGHALVECSNRGLCDTDTVRFINHLLGLLDNLVI